MALLMLVLISAAGALLALQMQPSAGVDTLVSRSNADYQATQLDARKFGGAPVVVLVRVPLTRLIEPTDLRRVSELEACLAGQRLAFRASLGALLPVRGGHAAPPYGGAASPCAALSRAHAVRAVYGPGTFLNRAVAAVRTEIGALGASTARTVRAAEQRALRLARVQGVGAARARTDAEQAGELALTQQLGALSLLASQMGLGGSPSIQNTAFLARIVFAGSRPNPRISYLFPSPGAALIEVRLRARLSASGEQHVIALIRRALTMPCFHLDGGSYEVTGEPVVLSDLSGALVHQLLLALCGAVVLMATVLILGFRARRRLAPLALALATVAITFGLGSLVGEPLTPATVAVVPVLVGLAVDYGVQSQSGTDPSAVLTAALATCAGFLALLFSPLPMVRGFGLLIVAGVVIAVSLVALSAPPPAGRWNPSQSRSQRAPGGPVPPAGVRRRVVAPIQLVDASARGAGEILSSLLPQPAAVLRRLSRRPGLVLTLGLVLAAAGWLLSAGMPVQSDVTKLVPADMPALTGLHALERATGVPGELDVIIHGADLASPRAIAWMTAYQQRIDSHFGAGRTGACTHASLCPVLSLPELLPTARGLTRGAIDTVLRSVPGYFRRAVITPDGHYAVLAFGIRLMGMTRQRRLLAYMRGALHPPAGIDARIAGLPALAADADGSLASSGRRLLMLGMSLLFAGVLLIVLLRSVRRALVPLTPIVLASGWSVLLLRALGIPLNPLSAMLGALVVAISTEFSVLLSERVYRELQDGWPVSVALQRAYRSTGTAVVISGVTAIAGFGVLTLSDIPILRDFGLVTLVDLTASLAGVLLVLPAVLTLFAPRGRIANVSLPQIGGYEQYGGYDQYAVNTEL